MSKNNIVMTEGPLWNKILLFALPLAATNILQQLFNAADVAVVGRFTGEMGSVCMAAVGANTTIINLVLQIFIGLSLGSNVVIARAIGMREEKTIERAIYTSLTVAILAGLIASTIGESVAYPVLSSMKVPAEVFPLSLLYLRIYFAGLPIIILYNFESAIFRAKGDTKTPLVVLAVSGVINILLNLLFVIVFNMNVAGVAIATVSSNLFSVVFLFVSLSRSEYHLSLNIKKYKLDKTIFTQILKIGIPSGIQGSVFSVANVIIQSCINSLGTVIMAASSAAANIELFALFILTSYGQTCTTFVGQNVGAGKPDRCKKTLRLCLIENLLIMGTVIFFLLTFSHQILGLFNTDPAVIAAGQQRLRLILSTYFFSFIYENMGGYLRGFGISATPAALTMSGVCVTRLLWVYFVFPKSPTFKCIMTVYPISLGITAVLLTIAVLILKPAAKMQKAAAV